MKTRPLRIRRSYSDAAKAAFEEMKAAVDEAALWGRRVAAHAHGTEAIKMAVRAGVGSIEHGSLIDDEGMLTDWWGYCWMILAEKRGLLTPENRAAARAAIEEKYLSAPNVIGVIVGR